MKLYLLTNNDSNGKDDYDGIVVCAKNEQDALNITPAFPRDYGVFKGRGSDWACSKDNVTVELIGTAKKGTERGIILKSFNAV